MRPVLGFVLAACVSLLPLALGHGNASAGFECGTFDGKFTCRSSSEGAQFGKNASPGGAPVTNQNSAPEPPAGGPGAIPPAGGAWTTDQGTAGATPDATVCQHGMVGTPPNCQCPKNSELLGGNCVHYTASACSNGLAPVPPTTNPPISTSLSVPTRSRVEILLKTPAAGAAVTVTDPVIPNR